MKKVVNTIILTAGMLFTAPQLFAQISVGISISAHIPPPALPVYTQPVCPEDGYIWTPGYWAYGDNGYFWTPGVWVRPPRPGILWTPAYWGYDGGIYGFHAGYWGAHVGFYGGINYGFGYGGVGFAGGGWSGNVYRYNTAVTNVNTTVVHNTYVNNTVINNTTNNTTNNNHTSFNGPGGANTQPNSQEQMAMREQHVQPTSQQLAHQQTASQDRSQLASVNNGRPATAAMNRVNGNRFNQQGRTANNAPAGNSNGGMRNPDNRTSGGMNRESRPDRAGNNVQAASVNQPNMNNQQNNANPNSQQNNVNPNSQQNNAMRMNRQHDGNNNGHPANNGADMRRNNQPHGQFARQQNHPAKQPHHEHERRG